MRKGRYQRRLFKIWKKLIKNRFLHGTIIVAIIIWVAEQLLGNVIVEFINNQSPRINTILLQTIRWINSHPGDTSRIIFFITLSIILIITYYETRSPRGIEISLAKVLNDLGPWFGVTIINNTGEDLFNCWVEFISVNNNNDLKEARANWGSRNRNPINIPNANSRNAYFVHRWNGTMRATLYSQGGPSLAEGITELQMNFHANTSNGDTITMPFWVNISVVNQNDIDEIEITSIYK